MNRLYEVSWTAWHDAESLAPILRPRASPFMHQRFLWCIRGSNSPWSEFVCGHGSCLLTKRGSKQHRHRPRRTKISSMRLVQHADLGVPNNPFQGLSECTPHTPPPEHSVGRNQATKAPTPENPLSWHNSARPREICYHQLNPPISTHLQHCLPWVCMFSTCHQMMNKD